MAEDTWNPWKMTLVGMLLVVAIGVVTGLVVAGWAPREGRRASGPVALTARGEHAAFQTPSSQDTDACNQFAKAQAGEKAIEVVKDGGQGASKGAVIGDMVGAAAGTLYGMNETKRNDARYVEAYRACMKGRGFSS